MAQHDYVIDNADGASFRADLNAMASAVQSLNSGSTAPVATAPHMLWADTSSGKLKQRNAADTAWVPIMDLGGQATPTGAQMAYAGRTAPTGWLLQYGQAVSRTTYADLYAVLCPVLGNVTISIASPGVVTLTDHGLADGDRIRLFTTGALPTGLSSNTDYYLVSTATNTFSLATTRGGTAINTSGTQSGTHTAQYFPYGAGDGSATFNVPDKRGRGSVGRDNMGGTAASRVTVAGSGVYGAALGAAGGAETHTLTITQMPSHDHASGAPVLFGPAAGSTGYVGAAGSRTGSTGGDGAHNNMQPSQVDNWIIKT